MPRTTLKITEVHGLNLDLIRSSKNSRLTFLILIINLISGWCYDQTGTFTVSFYILAVVSNLIIVALGLEDIFMKINNKRNDLIRQK